MAKEKKERMIADAEMQIQAQSEAAQKQIGKERESMLSGAKGYITNLALQLNGKILRDEKTSKDFMEKNIDTLSKS